MDQCEHLCLLLKHCKFPFEFVLSNIYRPPSKNVNIFLEQLKSFVSSDTIKNKKLIQIGDINICTIDKKKHSIDYLNILFANGLRNTIVDFTREEVSAGELKRSCLDHVNIRLKNDIKYHSFLIENKVADHYFVGCSIDIKNQNHIYQN